MHFVRFPHATQKTSRKPVFATPQAKYCDFLTHSFMFFFVASWAWTRKFEPHAVPEANFGQTAFLYLSVERLVLLCIAPKMLQKTDEILISGIVAVIETHASHCSTSINTRFCINGAYVRKSTFYCGFPNILQPNGCPRKLRKSRYHFQSRRVRR